MKKFLVLMILVVFLFIYSGCTTIKRASRDNQDAWIEEILKTYNTGDLWVENEKVLVSSGDGKLIYKDLSTLYSLEMIEIEREEIFLVAGVKCVLRNNAIKTLMRGNTGNVSKIKIEYVFGLGEIAYAIAQIPVESLTSISQETLKLLIDKGIEIRDSSFSEANTAMRNAMKLL